VGNDREGVYDMSIGVWDLNSHKLGSIDGDSIYANDQKVGTIVNGNKILDAHGREVGAIVNGNEIWDAHQHKVGAVFNGNEIWDAHQHKLGKVDGYASNIQIGAAGLLIFGLEAQQTNYTRMPTNSSYRESPSGCSGWLGAYIFLLTRNWGGRIGLLLGVVVLVVTLATGQAHDPLNGILIGFFAILLLGTIGGIIGAIINFIKKLVNKNK
jgi:hypothetical protein